MPANSKTIEFIFRSIDETTDVTKNIASAIGELDNKAQSVALPFAKIADGILKFNVALAAGGAAIAAYSTKVSGDFSESVREIGALFNANGEQLNELSDDILNYGRNSTSTIEDINKAVYLAISTGTEWTQVTEQLAEAEKLADIAGASLADTTAVLARTMNAYGAEVNESQRYTDALFTIVQNGDTDLTQLSANLGKVASDAFGAGASIEELGSAFAAVTVSGRNSAQTATLLAGLFRELSNPTAELQAALGGASIEANGLDGVLAALKESTGGSKSELDNLFGSAEAGKAAFVLVNDSAGTFNTTLDAMANKTGVVEKNLALFGESVNKAAANLATNAQIAFIEFGKTLETDVAGAISGLSGVFEGVSFSLNNGAFDPVITRIQQFIKNIASALDDVGENIEEALQSEKVQASLEELGIAFEDAVETYGDALARVFGDVDVSTADGLEEAISKAINLVRSLVNIGAEIVNQFDPVFDVIGRLAQETSNATSELETDVAKFLAAAKAIKEFGVVFAGFLVTLKESEADIGRVFDVIQGGAKVLVNSLQIVFDGIVAAVSAFFGAINSTADLLTLGQFDFGESASQQFELAAAAIENLKRNAQEGRDGIDLFISGIQGTAGATEDAGKGVGDLAKKTGEVAEAADKATLSDKEYKDQLAKTTEQLQKQLGILDDTEEGLAGASEATRKAGEANRQWFETIEPTGEALDNAATKALNYIGAVEKFGEGSEQANDAALEFLDTIEGADFDKLGGDVNSAAESIIDLADSQLDAAGAGKELAKTNQNVAETTKDNIDLFKAQSDRLVEMAKVVEDAEYKLEELASKERVSVLEITAEVKTAEIEAAVEQAKAILDVLSDSFASTGDVLSGAFGPLSDAAEKLGEYSDAYRTIKDEIEEERKLRTEMFELQRDLTEAQIEKIKAEVKRMEEGVTIHIDAGDMEEEVYAFIHKIVAKWRVLAMGSEAELLLGLNGGDA